MLTGTLLTFALLIPSADTKGSSSFPRSDMLVQAEDLKQTRNANDTVLLDARSKQHYDDGHIAGAVLWDTKDTAEAVAPATLARLGIGPKTRVIVYDDGIVRDAARLWWRLKYSGLEKVALLDGGLSAWTAAGGKLTTAPSPKTENRELEALSPSKRLATRDQVLEVLKSKSAQIVDARSEKEFCGLIHQAKRGGCIPGAIHLEWTDLIDSKTKKFKSADELKKLFEDDGIELKKPQVTYCQSGGRASVMAFGLELMGAKDVRNYYKSWAEWGNDPNTPIETPEHERKE